MAAFDEKEYTKAFDLKIWKRLLPILARYKKTIVLMAVVNGLTAMMDVILPLFQKYAISRFIERGTLDGLPLYTAAYLGVILLETLMVVGWSRKAMYVEMYLGRDMRRDLFGHLQTTPPCPFTTSPRWATSSPG